MAEILQFVQPRLPPRRRRGPATILPFIGVRYERTEPGQTTETRPVPPLPPQVTGLPPEL